MNSLNERKGLETYEAGHRRLCRVVFILCCLSLTLALVLVYVGLSGLYTAAHAVEPVPEEIHAMAQALQGRAPARVMRGKTFHVHTEKTKRPPTYWAGEPGDKADACPNGQHGHDYQCPMPHPHTPGINNHLLSESEPK